MTLEKFDTTRYGIELKLSLIEEQLELNFTTFNNKTNSRLNVLNDALSKVEDTVLIKIDAINDKLLLVNNSLLKQTDNIKSMNDTITIKNAELVSTDRVLNVSLIKVSSDSLVLSVSKLNRPSSHVRGSQTLTVTMDSNDKILGFPNLGIGSITTCNRPSGSGSCLQIDRTMLLYISADAGTNGVTSQLNLKTNGVEDSLVIGLTNGVRTGATIMVMNGDTLFYTNSGTSSNTKSPFIFI